MRNYKIYRIDFYLYYKKLDVETLDQALALLEKFHKDTKQKIIIISHVEILKERIPVKIKVDRISQGFSKINLDGGE